MIRLKDKINKRQTLMKLKEIAMLKYSACWEPELEIAAFMDGCHQLLKLLRLPSVKEEEKKWD